MSTQATSTFDNLTWDQSTYDEYDGGPVLHRVRIERSFSGALLGSSTAELLMCQSDDDHAGYVATDRFVGSLNGHTGSFVLQHGGAYERGETRPFGYIVPGSGTGELGGLRGEAHFAVGPNGEHSLTLDYEVEG